MEITDQYLTFVMNAEKYAIPVVNVRELLTAEDLGCLESAVEAETEA